MVELSEVRELAESLMAEHLARKKHEWTFRFDHARRRAGACHHETREISLSRHIVVLGSLDDVRQIILHEIAHALCGWRHGHSQKWLDTARAIGYTGWITHAGPVAEHLATWRGTCPSGHVINRFRKPRRMTVSCSVCSPVYSTRHAITWERLG